MIKNFGHRGFSGEYPENTMLSFRKAHEAGADGIELDVHLSLDGEVMIQHDEAMKRTSGLEGFIFNYTRSQLEKISAGKTKNDEFGFTPIPSLEEYLSWVKDTGMVTNIEMKTAPVYYPGIEEKTLELVRRFGLEDRIIFSSFNWLSCQKLKRLAPEIGCGLLFDGIKIYNMGPIVKDDGYDYFHPDIRFTDEKFVSDMKKSGIGCNVWTVNEEEDIRNCIRWGVNGIIGNHPDRVKRLLAEAGND